MSGMYPDNQNIEIFGEQVNWPGVNADGKFTNGSFSDPMVKPSFIPAETINLILDNLESVIRKCGGTPNATSAAQIVQLLTHLASPKTIVMRDEHGRAKVAAPEEEDDIARLADINVLISNSETGINATIVSQINALENVCCNLQAQINLITTTEIGNLYETLQNLLNIYLPVGTIYESVVNRSPAEFMGGTWTVWGEGRVSVGVLFDEDDPDYPDFGEAEHEGGASTVALEVKHMPRHRHSQSAHSHTIPMGDFDNKNQNAGSAYYHYCRYTGYSFSTNTATPPALGLTGGLSTDAENACQPHENKMKFITSYKWKRTA